MIKRIANMQEVVEEEEEEEEICAHIVERGE